MSESGDLSKKAKQMAEAIDKGRVDPLQLSLIDPYRQLKDLQDRLPARLTIDEILNNILGAKVHRIQELARILLAPDVYVKILQRMTTRQVGKAMRYRRPLTIPKLDYHNLSKALERLLRGITAQAERPTGDSSDDDDTDAQEEFVIRTEEAITLEKITAFYDALPANETISIHAILKSDDIDVILERFLMIIILISRGLLVYDSDNQTLTKITTDKRGQQ
ncbi:MAG: hypothetical protein K9W43_06275 [Candidatus Thorarchaeota archaeon]|nr:hypothetical protein [Candidatus Thorarchaeota archaeon]